ncbi:hypothetical protein LAC81_15070 [Ensifer adhaerens]|uniref:hypothetical protein n=1 Tax=Ensifer adhaerens TaxID=106592 RepID=UPI001CBBFC2C|nr:hypothetical protein [Ensifer adhaerens]MBZ7923111.1 hypothetical protein [Ensifer adhaerens]UAX91701.1 hypothetical protein LAC78_15065 [Ensifer adhaerens]UAX99329.1 hypothetical protein LAC80_15070 [Ensifer adhaerens]UAY06712.1 hypothetical protein LAC81_15070 [Ensifer adhaerens]
MLAPEALRLLIVEILCPTAAIAGTEAFPTVAGNLVYDSREIPVQDIDRDRDFTPVIAVHGNDARITSRGELTDFSDVEQQAVIDIVVELAVVAEDNQGEFADAMAGTDPTARLVLAALCSRIRYLLEFSEKGVAWRRLVRRVVNLEEMPFSVPDLGLRFQRMTLRYTIEIAPDTYCEDGGLPEPIRSVAATLPDGSYAKLKLQQLGAYFLAESPEALQEIAGTAHVTERVDLTVGVSSLSS